MKAMIGVKECLLLIMVIVGSQSVNPQLPKHVIQVYGNFSLGYYYAKIYIGSPPQEQSVIIDTGSRQLALPCNLCTGCGRHLNPPFNLNKSSTGKVVTCDSGSKQCASRCIFLNSDPCTFNVRYQEGSSISGTLIEDNIQFEGDSVGESITTTFGCTLDETDRFKSQAANGIFGFAPNRNDRLLDLLYEKHHPFTGEQLLFSMCYSKNGGQLAIGRVEEKLIEKITPAKTGFNSGKNRYQLTSVQSISIGKNILFDKGSQKIIIDSGSTMTNLPERQYNILQQEIESRCTSHFQQCKIASKQGNLWLSIIVKDGHTLRSTVLDIFPSFDIKIDGKTVSWLPDRYFISYGSTNAVCLAITTFQGLDFYVLGVNWMVDRNMVFDLKEKTVEIYSGVECTASENKDELPLLIDTPQEKPKQQDKPSESIINIRTLLAFFTGASIPVGAYALKGKFTKASTKPKNETVEDENATIGGDISMNNLKPHDKIKGNSIASVQIAE